MVRRKRRKIRINYSKRVIICNQCGYSWNPRVLIPKQCPRCHSEKYGSQRTPRFPSDIKHEDRYKNYSVKRVINDFKVTKYWNRKDFYDVAEENLPDLIEKQVNLCYPAEPVQKYCWGKIAKETTWLFIIVIRSRDEESEISFIKEKIRDRWEKRTYTLKDDIATKLKKNHVILLDYRSINKK